MEIEINNFVVIKTHDSPLRDQGEQSNENNSLGLETVEAMLLQITLLIEELNEIEEKS